LKLRCDLKTKDAPIQAKVELRANGQVIYSYGPEVVTDKQVIVRDRFAGHYPVKFKASFSDDSVDIALRYSEGDFQWDDQFTLEKGKEIQRIVPTIKALAKISDLKFEYDVLPNSGDPFTKQAQGRLLPILVKSTAS